MKYLMAVVVFGGLGILAFIEALWVWEITDSHLRLWAVCGAVLTALAIVVLISMLFEAKRNNWWE